jgi:hypothetical protein
VIISRDVTFDEGGVWNWSSEFKKKQIMIPESYQETKEKQESILNIPESSGRPKRQHKLPAKFLFLWH